MAHSLKKEILRKLIHLLEIPVVLGYSLIRYFWSQEIAIVVLTALLLILIEIEYVRLEVKPKIPKVLNLFRLREKNNLTGTVFFLLSTIIAFSAFDYGIAMLALLMTVFGDLVSALVGIKYGKQKLIYNKTMEGFLAGLGANLVLGFLILPDLLSITVSMALVASIVELLTNKLDDNLTVPLFAGFAGQMLVYMLGVSMVVFPEPFSWLFYFF